MTGYTPNLGFRSVEDEVILTSVYDTYRNQVPIEESPVLYSVLANAFCLRQQRQDGRPHTCAVSTIISIQTVHSPPLMRFPSLRRE